MSTKKESERTDAPWTTPGTDHPKKRPGPFAPDPLRAPPTKEQQEPDDKMDAVVRNTPLQARRLRYPKRVDRRELPHNRSEGSSTRRDGPDVM